MADSRNNAPGSLHTELLEKSGGDNSIARGVGIWVEEGTADDANENDAESAAKDLRRITDHDTADHGTDVGDDLSHC